MRALCYKCGHSWNYKGEIKEGKKYITCSGCYYKIRIDRTLDFSTEEHQKLLTNPVKLPSLPHKLPTTHHSFKLKSILNLNNLTPEMFGLEKEHTPYRKIIERPQTEFIEIEEGSNLCDIHNLPASYDDKVWTCRECRKIETPNAEPVIYPSAQINKIPKEEFKIIPRDPIKLLEHQRSFF